MHVITIVKYVNSFSLYDFSFLLDKKVEKTSQIKNREIWLPEKIWKKSDFPYTFFWSERFQATMYRPTHEVSYDNYPQAADVHHIYIYINIIKFADRYSHPEL